MLKTFDVEYNGNNYISSHLVPNMENRFMVTFDDSQLIHLVDVETGKK